MKALLFLPFTFAAGAEGFALFAPYLIGVLSVLYFARLHRSGGRRLIPVVRLARIRACGAVPNAHPAL
jgi:hypothetical protein